jgi:predicted AlkP superfamily pyrophosphatase or phosphodiesterase
LLNKKNIAVLVLSLAALAAPPAYSDDGQDKGPIKRVLLISIDGMHAVDFGNCAKNNTCPHLAALATRGVTFTWRTGLPFTPTISTLSIRLPEEK